MSDQACDGRNLAFAEKISPQHTALLVVDVQNDFCHPDGFFSRSGPADYTDLSMVNRMRAPLLILLESARAVDAFRVFIRGVYDPIYVTPPFAEKLRELQAYDRACLEDTWGADYWHPFVLEPGRREVEVVKHRYSAFHDTKLTVVLRANEIRTVIVAGVATSGCVCSTARDALFNDFYVIIPEDATADYTEANHRSHLRKLGSTFGTIVPTERIVDAWRR